MNLRPRTPGIAMLVACVLAAANPVIGQDDPNVSEEPLELGLEENVDIEFILVDFMVLDRKGRTVPGLTVDDFELLVDHRLTEISSLDLDCPLGAAREPRAGAKRTGEALPPTALPRRIVLVFDYDHMANPTQTFDDVLDLLDRRPRGDEEHMIASLGGVVRIETPFTTDLDELRWTVRRMRNDRDLYTGFRGRTTDHRFFERIKALFDILERWPGRKTIVLFSGAFEADGFFHDPQHMELSALATTTRTAVYPVDTGGMRADGSRGGPATLARLAVETGGRMTANTNDLSLGYSRAHRDLGCNYTLGFHDPRPKYDKAHRLLLRVKDKRYRVVYPDFYVVRSPEAKRESIRRTASLAPHMFESEHVNAKLFVVGPASFERWRTVVGVEVRLAPGEEVHEGATWDMEGTLRKPNGTIVRSFRRRVPVWRLGGDGADEVVTLFQEIVVPPGDYVLSVVVSDPDKGTPRAASRPVNLTRVPRRGSFVLGPILGHRSETASAAGGRDRADPAFRPLITPSTKRGQDLESLTVVCVRGQEIGDGMRPVARWISTFDGEDVHHLDEAQVRLIGGGKVHCQKLVDALSTAALEPGRYEINAVLELAEYATETGSAEFVVDLPAESDR